MMRHYLDLMNDILKNGTIKANRTGVDTLSVFGRQMRFDLQEGFPLVTTKKVHFKSVIHELLWFLRGETNVKSLNAQGVTIWDEWADENGELGPIYGYQWRSWPVPQMIPGHAIGYEWEPTHIELRPLDQIADVIQKIIKDPDNRRLIVSAWNVADIPKMALAPCHLLFQFNTRELDQDDRWDLYVKNGGMRSYGDFLMQYPTLVDYEVQKFLDREGISRRKLDCLMYQRSCDFFLGVPFNIASYALLTMMVAQVTGCLPGEFIWTGGDVHLYVNHLEQVRLQLTREPKPLPRMRINPAVQSIDGFCYEDFTLEGYDPYPAIKAPVAV